MKKQKKIKLTSVSYIHDPESAQKWFEAYVEIVKKELTKAVEKD